MRSTIRDVAREAKVSVATVSRVINRSGPVSPDTRERIEAVARRLRYVPNGAARSLTMRRTYMLGALLPELHGEFFSEVIRGIDQEAQRQGYHLLVSSSHSAEAEIARAVQVMRGRVDGLIVMSPRVPASALEAYLPDGVPVVLIASRVEGTRFASLCVDNFGGAYAMVSHLVEEGHRRIALIEGAAGNFDTTERERGYRAALQKHGIEPDAALQVPGDFTEFSGYEAVRRILEVRPAPTAIFAANDAMAIGALSALRDAGVRVPEQMAVAGFDDIPIARYLRPPLTSVNVSIHQLGARAVSHLLSVVEGASPSARHREVLPTRVVVRESTRAAG
jgi:LacI family transcriptional regulator